MIHIICRNRDRETELVERLHGEIGGRIYTNFPIKGKTRKTRRGRGYRLYEVVNSHA